MIQRIQTDLTLYWVLYRTPILIGLLAGGLAAVGGWLLQSNWLMRHALLVPGAVAFGAPLCILERRLTAARYRWLALTPLDRHAPVVLVMLVLASLPAGLEVPLGELEGSANGSVTWCAASPMWMMPIFLMQYWVIRRLLVGNRNAPTFGALGAMVFPAVMIMYFPLLLSLGGGDWLGWGMAGLLFHPLLFVLLLIGYGLWSGWLADFYRRYYHTLLTAKPSDNIWDLLTGR